MDMTLASKYMRTKCCDAPILRSISYTQWLSTGHYQYECMECHKVYDGVSLSYCIIAKPDQWSDIIDIMERQMDYYIHHNHRTVCCNAPLLWNSSELKFVCWECKMQWGVTYGVSPFYSIDKPDKWTDVIDIMEQQMDIHSEPTRSTVWKNVRTLCCRAPILVYIHTGQLWHDYECVGCRKVYDSRTLPYYTINKPDEWLSIISIMEP